MAPTVDELAVSYRDALVALDEAKAAGRRDRVLKRLVDQAQSFHLQLRRTPAGRAAISDLVDDDVEEVRIWSAVNALAWDESRARAVLDAVAAGDDMRAFNARITLREHELGNLRTDWVPAGSDLDTTHWETPVESPPSPTRTPLELSGPTPKPMVDAAEVRRRLVAECPTIGARAAELLQACIRFAAVAVDDIDAPTAASKLGGSPDVPAGWEWPTWQRDEVVHPLTFVGQVDLDEVATLGQSLPVPATGLLSFFVDYWAIIDGPDDPVAWRVYWFDRQSGLQRAAGAYSGSLDAPMVAAGSALLVPVASVSLPSAFDPRLDDARPDEAELDAYSDIRAMTGSTQPGGGCHQLLGHDDGTQMPMAEAVDASYERSVQAGRVPPRPGARDWRLLLQIDSDADVGLSWGGEDRIHFAIDADDLSNQAFGSVWFDTQ